MSLDHLPVEIDAGWNIFSFQWWSPVWMHHLVPMLPKDFPVWTDFWIAIPLALVITAVRLWVCDPIASRIVVSQLGLAKTSLRQRNAKEAPGKRIPAWVLNEIDGFALDMLILKKRMKKKRFSSVEIKLAKQTKWKQFVSHVIEMSASGTRDGGKLEIGQLNSWWGVIKRDSARSLEIQKFNEAFWRCAFYTFIWCYGIWVGYREHWLLDMRAIWAGWPLEQRASSEVRWYYFLSMGHYIHLFVTQFWEPKRKDWWEMFIHHIVTMALLFFSYVVNFVRIGTVVLLCHDGSDVFLELAKLFNYLKFGTLCDATFVIFALAFFVGRLVLYPWRVVYVAVVLGAEQVGVWRGFYIFVLLLLVLQVLHLFWFYTIVCMVWAFASTGGVEKDVREETESEPEEVTGAAVPQPSILDAATAAKSKSDNQAEQAELRQRGQKQSAPAVAQSSGSRASHKK